MEWGKLRHGGRDGSCPQPAPSLLPGLRAHLPCCKAPSRRTDLVLAAPAGVVQVVVAPVVMGPVLRLLIQPVELVGAALHVVLQGIQILLPLLGAGLGRVRGRAQPKAPLRVSPGGARPPQQGTPAKGLCPQGLRGLLPAASDIWPGSRSCIPGKRGEASQALGARLWGVVV